MKNEDKVATLEQCKKLVELGVILRTEKSWFKGLYGKWELVNYLVNKGCIDAKGGMPAPDVSEFGVLIPVDLGTDEHSRYSTFHSMKCGDKWASELGTEWSSCLCDTEARARAEALIWLIENKYLNPDELNL